MNVRLNRIREMQFRAPYLFIYLVYLFLLYKGVYKYIALVQEPL